MRILHLASEYPPIQVFGLGRAVHDLAVAQAHMGEDVHVVTNSIGGRDQDVVEDGVNVHRIDFPPPPKPPDDTMAVLQFNVSAVETATRFVDESAPPDVIHAHDWLTSHSGILLKWLYPEAVLAATIHDTAKVKHFGRLDMPQQYSAHLERWIGIAADRILCCSEFVRDEMVNGYDCPQDKITVIPCGVDEAQFGVDGDLEGFRTVFAKPGDRLVLYIGRLDPEKGVDVLLNAMSQVVAIEPAAKLLVVGKGRSQQALQEQLRGLNLGERVEFAGYLTGTVLAAVLRLAELLVVPSLYEPFGIVALEGMANRTPVIASSIGGLREIIRHNQTGYLVPPRDARALAGAIVAMMSDPDTRARLAQNAYACATQDYTWTSVACRTAAAYRAPQPAIG